MGPNMRKETGAYFTTNLHDTRIMSNASRYETFLADKMKEGERLHLQHKHVKRYMGDRLLYAPMTTAQQGLRVLDVATSDGKAAIHCWKDHSLFH